MPSQNLKVLHQIEIGRKRRNYLFGPLPYPPPSKSQTLFEPMIIIYIFRFRFR